MKRQWGTHPMRVAIGQPRSVNRDRNRLLQARVQGRAGYHLKRGLESSTERREEV